MPNLADLRRQFQDSAGDFGETPYLLEVTSPGIDRPLTVDRHWRRAQGRKVRIKLRTGAPSPDPKSSDKFEARVGVLTDDTVALVLGLLAWYYVKFDAEQYEILAMLVFGESMFVFFVFAVISVPAEL